MPMKILVVTSIHPDLDARIWKHATSVAEAGHEVVLVAPWASALPPAPPSLRMAAFPRVTRRVLRPLLVPWRVLRTVGRHLDGASLVHFHDLDLLPWMTWLSRRVPVVYDVHENYPEEMLVKRYVPRPLRRPLSGLVRGFEDACARRVAGLVVVVPDQVRRFGGRVRRLLLLRNFASRLLLESARPETYLQRDPVVLFTGSMYEENGSLLLLDIARRVLSVHPTARFELVDRFPSAERRAEFLARREETGVADRIVLLPNVPPQRLMEHLNRGVVGIIPNLRVAKQEMALPTKIFEYMAAGLPIVASDLRTQVPYLTESGCGALARPEDPQTFVDPILSLLNDRRRAEETGLRGRAAFLERYSYEAQVPALLDLYREIVGNGTGKGAM